MSLAAMLLAMAAPVAAQDSAARSDAAIIVSVSGFERQAQTAIADMAPLLSASIIGGIANEPDGDAVLAAIDAGFPGGRDAFATRFTAEFIEKFTLRLPEVQASMVDYLVDNMTPAQLREVRTFMQTDAGAAYAAISLPLQDYMGSEGERIGGEVAASILPSMLEFLTKGAESK